MATSPAAAAFEEPLQALKKLLEDGHRLAEDKNPQEFANDFLEELESLRVQVNEAYDGLRAQGHASRPKAGDFPDSETGRQQFRESERLWMKACEATVEATSAWAKYLLAIVHKGIQLLRDVLSFIKEVALAAAHGAKDVALAVAHGAKDVVQQSYAKVKEFLAWLDQALTPANRPTTKFY